MCSAFKCLAILWLALTVAANDKPVLRVAADPNNLPFSNDKGEGFENRLAELVANELGMRVEYTWRAQRRGFFRETLQAGQADLVCGVPAGFERALTTKPYYRSTYVFVSRADTSLDIDSFDDPRLRTARIGVQLIGDDGINTPPAHALTDRGIVTNLVGFTVYGDYKEANPPAQIIEAVARNEVDVAVVWGPLAGYFARRSPTPLRIKPVRESGHDLQLSFGIAMGVRKSDKELRDRIDAALQTRRADVERILTEYGVPLATGTNGNRAP
jgi:mxaJ protein